MRNLFRFGRAPAAPAPAAPPVAVEPARPTGPTTPAAPTIPPIPLKFVGTMKVGGRMMAVLSDGSGRSEVPCTGSKATPSWGSTASSA